MRYDEIYWEKKEFKLFLIVHMYLSRVDKLS